MATIRNLLMGICISLLIFISVNGLAAVNKLDRIVAIVNEDVISASELDSRVKELASQLVQKGATLPPLEVVQAQVLDSMIAKRLQLQIAKQLGLTVDDTTVTKAITNIAQTNNVTLLQLKEILEADGISFNLFREQLREDILINRLRQKEVINQIVITDQDVRNYLERETGSSRQRLAVHLQHILIATPEGASPEDVQAAKEKAERLVKELRNGADFSNMAIRESDARQALEGGDLGWMESNRIPSLFIQEIDNMEPGDISDPIRNASGFHIIKLDEVKGTQRTIITQTHARHILITTNELVSDTEAQHHLETLRERIIGGESFEALARSHSDDKASAIKGGDLGWTNPGDMVPAFEQQMDALQPTQISEPFKTQFGWHIVQVLERRDYDNTEEVIKNNARMELRQQKADEAIELWLRRLRDEAYVEILLDQDDL
ncbi:MAG: peptidylprolyl isomerase [Chromatiales bacterium]